MTLGTLSKKARAFWSKEWGVNENCILTSIPGFEVTKSLLHDPMHDILEGVARYELRAMLHLFVVKKLFTLAKLNSRINNFEYTAGEAKDKSQALDSRSLEPGSKLGQSAASIKNPMTLLPCVIGDKMGKTTSSRKRCEH